MGAAAGPDGQGRCADLVLRPLGALALAFPCWSARLRSTAASARWSCSTPSRIGVEPDRRLRRADLRGPCRLLRCRRLLSLFGFYTVGFAADRGHTARSPCRLSIAALIGVPTLRLRGHYFAWRRSRSPSSCACWSSTGRWLGGAQGLSRSGGAAHRARPLVHLSLCPTITCSWPCWPLLATDVADRTQPHGLLSCAPSREPSGPPVAWACRSAATSSTPSC